MPYLTRVLNERANGVSDESGRFFPYRSISGTATAATALIARLGIRYYIKQITTTLFSEAVVAAGSWVVTGSLGNIPATVIHQHNQGATVATEVLNTIMTTEPKVLTDYMVAVAFTLTTCTGNFVCTYAEIDEIEGEYSR